MPQLYKNWAHGDASSLSATFLANWLAGDVANVVGCVLTGQLPFQTYLASYFVSIDTLLMVQYLFYTKWRSFRRKRRRAFDHPSVAVTQAVHQPTEDTPLLPSPSLSRRNSPLFAVMFMALSTFATPSLHTHEKTTAKILSDPLSETEQTHTIGLLMAWACTFLYLSSRLPQLYHNMCRGSTYGLSISMFFCAAMGNLTYVASILLRSTEPEFLKGALPYLLGSGGTLVFDFLIFGQWVFLGSSEERVVVQDEFEEFKVEDAV
ncbi:hypothetical protein SpCBS45565_g02384 [Spizellomyces sp. 'palustris']|nr:hypothetical protein SpCBS45565_g02384 [Spizellomyces sp. 'palustris']